MKNRIYILRVFILIFITTLVIIGVKHLVPQSKAEQTATSTIDGNNSGYGMVTVTYHSNYLLGTAENGEKATEETYQITTPIYLNSKGEYCISFGEYKFKEMQVSSDGVTAQNEDVNAIDTGFRGYTLSRKPSEMIDETTGFWIGKETNSSGPDEIPQTALANTTKSIKTIFNDWADGIYQQGDELVLSSSNLDGYNNIKYSANYDSNRNGGTGANGDTRNNYSIDIYAQWVKANVVYVASTNTDAKAEELNTTFGVKNITKDKIETSIPNAVKKVNTQGNNYYENYIVITDYNANSSMGYSINPTANTNGNGFTITSKYFGQDTLGRICINTDSSGVVMHEALRIRSIDIYTVNPGTGRNEIYTQGHAFITEYGIRTFSGTSATSAAGNETTNNISERGAFNIDADGYSGFSTSRASYVKVLSGHTYRITTDRWSNTQYKNKYAYYQIGGTTVVDILLAGPAQGTIVDTTSYMTIKDMAKVKNVYGGNQGWSSSNYKANDCTSYINIYGNANIINAIYGGGAGRQNSIPFFSGEIYINVCGGNVNNIYGVGASSCIVKKSDGSDSNIYINILGGKVSTVYGGGIGMNDDAENALTKFSLINGSLNGNVFINTSNCLIGNIYGSGEGYNGKEAAIGCAYRNGDATITIKSGTIVEGNVYGGGNLGDVSSNTTIKIEKGTIEEVFGGGYTGTVGGNTEIQIISGNFTNIFGGGNQSYVTGNTKVVIGAETDSGVTVTGIVYGGGKGYDEDNDGDASNYTTVYGMTEVLIQGTKTNVENYGSIKYGNVQGDINVTFKDYWTGNATAKYKTMNGIDRATTVEFNNSYVLLENKNTETGKLEGIKSIGNLKIPKGSGLKISADGEITGNFEGGGELYLDSQVCLTVGGNISGVTTLILNPLLYENEDEDLDIIKGGIENPYMKVAGTVLTPEEDGKALVSGQKRYQILEASPEETSTGCTHFYIVEDVIITNTIDVETINAKDKKYTGTIEDQANVNIINNESFSSNIKIDYMKKINGEDDENYDSYTNLSRKFMIKISEDTEALIPAGTEIMLIKDNTYYTYIVPTDTNKIELRNFKNNNNQSFSEIKDITTADGVEKEVNQITGFTTYRYHEKFKFIVNFANSETKIANGTYYPIIEVTDAESLSVQENNAINIIEIKSREYTYNYKTVKEEQENNGIININGEMKISEISNIQEEKDLYAKVKLVSINDDNVEEERDIPSGTELMINNKNNYEIANGTTQIKLIENLTNLETIQELNIEIDMSKVLPQYRLQAGNYKLILELVLGENDVLQSITQSTIKIPLIIIDNLENKKGYGLKAILQNEENIATDKLQLITKENGTETVKRTISLQYNGILENAKVKIIVLEKTGVFEYTDTVNSSNIQVKLEGNKIEELTDLINNPEVEISFPSNLDDGTYKIVFELYDKNDTKLTNTSVNFIVDNK